MSFVGCHEPFDFKLKFNKSRIQIFHHDTIIWANRAASTGILCRLAVLFKLWGKVIPTRDQLKDLVTVPHYILKAATSSRHWPHRLSPLQQTDRSVRPLHLWCNVCLMISSKILIPWSSSPYYTVATHCPRFIERVIIRSCIVIGGGYISLPVLRLLEVQLALFAYYR